MTSHDSLTWTWTAPSGERFKGTPDFIDGVKFGWERAWEAPRPRCKFTATCEHSHPDDIATHEHGGTW